MKSPVMSIVQGSMDSEGSHDIGFNMVADEQVLSNCNSFQLKLRKLAELRKPYFFKVHFHNAELNYRKYKRVTQRTMNSSNAAKY